MILFIRKKITSSIVDKEIIFKKVRNFVIFPDVSMAGVAGSNLVFLIVECFYMNNFLYELFKN